MYRSSFALVLLAAASMTHAQNHDPNGPRTDQQQGTSSYIQGNEGRGGTTIGGVGISRQQDIRRTSTGALTLSQQKITALKTAVRNANLARSPTVAFTVAVGAAVPKQAGAKDLPPSIEAIVPGGGAMNYVLVQNRLILIDKKTGRIVAIVPGIG